MSLHRTSFCIVNDSNISTFRKFGHNADVGTSHEYIQSSGTTTYDGWLTSATTLRIAAGGDALDTAAGDGVRSVKVYGLDTNFNLISEEIATAGISASSSTTQNFIRFYRGHSVDTGAARALPSADINIETTGGTAMGIIDADSGQTEMLIYTVPNDHRLVVNSIIINVNSSNQADIEFWKMEDANATGAPYSGARLWHRATDFTGRSLVDIGDNVFYPYTDIWATAKRTLGASCDVSIEVIGKLYKDY